MAEPIYRRVVIKLSGEYLAGSQSFGFDQPTIDRIAGDLIAARQLGSEIAVVVGLGSRSRLLFEHDLSGKSGSAFPDRALGKAIASWLSRSIVGW